MERPLAPPDYLHHPHTAHYPATASTAAAGGRRSLSRAGEEGGGGRGVLLMHLGQVISPAVSRPRTYFSFQAVKPPHDGHVGFSEVLNVGLNTSIQCEAGVMCVVCPAVCPSVHLSICPSVRLTSLAFKTAFR